MARGGGLNLVGAVLQQACLFLIITLLANVLGKDDVGRYASGFALLSLLGLLAMAGFRSGLTRFVAIHLADEDPSRLRGTLRLGLGITAAASGALAGLLVLFAPQVAELMHDPELATGVRLVALTLPAHALSEAALAATQGWRSQKAYTLIGRVFDPVLRLALTAAAVVAGYGYVGAMWSLATASWVTAVLALVALLRRMRGVPASRAAYRIRDIMSFSMVSWASALAATGLIWADTLILGAMTDQGQVGVYNVATRLVTLAVFVMPPITATFGPHMAHLHHVEDHAGAARAYGSATRWTLLLSMPAFVVLLVFPDQLLRLFGGEFAAGAAVTVILAVGQLVGAAAGPCGVVLNMSGRVMLSLLDNGLILALNVALNFLLIPRLGMVGAALAWSVSLVVVNLVKVVQAWRVVGIRAEGAGTGKIALAALPATGAGLLIDHVVSGWVLSLVVGGLATVAIYLGMLLLLRPHPEDLRMLRKLVEKLLRRGPRGPRRPGGSDGPGRDVRPNPESDLRVPALSPQHQRVSGIVDAAGGVDRASSRIPREQARVMSQPLTAEATVAPQKAPSRAGRVLGVAIQVLLAVIVAGAALVSGFSFVGGNKMLAVLPIVATAAIGLGLLSLTRFSGFVLLLLAVRPSIDLLKLSSNSTGTAVGNTAAQRGLDPSSILGVLFLLAAVVWLAGRIHSKQMVKGSRLRVAMLAFLAAGALSVVGSTHLQASALEVMRLAAVAMMFIVLEQMIRTREQLIRVIAICYVALLFPLAYTLFGFATGNVASEVHGSFTRLTGPFNQSNTFSRYLAFLIVFGVAIFPFVWPQLKLVFVGMLGLSSVFMMLTLTRTAILGTVAGVVILAIVQRRKGLIMGLVAMAIASLMVLPGVAGRFGTLDAQSTPTGTPTGNTLVWRIKYWTEVLPLANANPISGIGLDSTQYQTDAAKQPHNDFIRAYVETGVVGLFAYISMLTALVGNARRAVQRAIKGSLEHAVAAGALACAVCFVLSSVAANVMSNVVSLWYLFSFAAAAAYVSRTNTPAVQTAPGRGVVATPVRTTS